MSIVCISIIAHMNIVCVPGTLQAVQISAPGFVNVQTGGVHVYYQPQLRRAAGGRSPVAGAGTGDEVSVGEQLHNTRVSTALP